MIEQGLQLKVDIPSYIFSSSHRLHDRCRDVFLLMHGECNYFPKLHKNSCDYLLIIHWTTQRSHASNGRHPLYTLKILIWQNRTSLKFKKLSFFRSLSCRTKANPATHWLTFGHVFRTQLCGIALIISYLFLQKDENFIQDSAKTSR